LKSRNIKNIGPTTNKIDINTWEVKYNNIALVDEKFVDFAKHYPDLKSYNHEDNKKIIINNITSNA
jgi:hypothetical protein